MDVSDLDTAAGLTVVPLTDFGLGALVRLGPTADRDPALPRTLLERLDQAGVLVVRGLDLTCERYVALASGFGTPEPVFPQAHQDPASPVVRLQSSVAGVGVASGGEYWHADGPLTEEPTALTLLWCERAPERGGETLFADNRRAWDRLPEALRSRVAGRRGHYPCRAVAIREMRDAGVPEEEQRAKLADLRDLHHPLVRRHPRTGRPALYLNQQWLAAIEDEPDPAVLPALYEAATAESNVYRHRWQPGDLVLWDNAAVMHRALPPAAGTAKTTRRITIRDVTSPSTPPPGC